MKDNIIRLAILIGLPTFTYFGFVDGHNGPRYLVLFFVWAWCLPVGIFAASSAAYHVKAAKDPVPHSAWRFLHRCVGWFVLITLVWTGHIWTATAWGFFMLCATIFREGVTRVRAKEQQ